MHIFFISQTYSLVLCDESWENSQCCRNGALCTGQCCLFWGAADRDSLLDDQSRNWCDLGCIAAVGWGRQILKYLNYMSMFNFSYSYSCQCCNFSSVSSTGDYFTCLLSLNSSSSAIGWGGNNRGQDSVNFTDGVLDLQEILKNSLHWGGGCVTFYHILQSLILKFVTSNECWLTTLVIGIKQFFCIFGYVTLSNFSG